MALALALFITALPPPSCADVGQPDHDNASAAGLQLEAPLNEHEPVRDAARVMQPKMTATAEGAASEEEAAAAAMAAGSARPPLLLVLWASSQLSGGVRPGPVVDFRRGEAAL